MLNELNSIAAGLLGLHGYPLAPIARPQPRPQPARQRPAAPSSRRDRNVADTRSACAADSVLRAGAGRA